LAGKVAWVSFLLEVEINDAASSWVPSKRLAPNWNTLGSESTTAARELVVVFAVPDVVVVCVVTVLVVFVEVVIIAAVIDGECKLDADISKEGGELLEIV
jgi:hypothetical protein